MWTSKRLGEGGLRSRLLPGAHEAISSEGRGGDRSLGFRVWGFVFKVEGLGLGFRVWGLRFRA